MPNEVEILWIKKVDFYVNHKNFFTIVNGKYHWGKNDKLFFRLEFAWVANNFSKFLRSRKKTKMRVLVTIPGINSSPSWLKKKKLLFNIESTWVWNFIFKFSIQFPRKIFPVMPLFMTSLGSKRRLKNVFENFFFIVENITRLKFYVCKIMPSGDLIL